MEQVLKNMKVKIETNIKQFQKDLMRFEKVDIPNVTRIALNETANKVKKFEQLTMKKVFDRPRKQTINSIFVKYARSKNLTAVITFRDWAQDFIRQNVKGGIRKVTNTAVPTLNAKLNQYGNIPGRRAGVVKKNQFRAVIKGIYGVWEKNKKTGKLTIIHRFETNPKYERLFPFFRVAGKTANKFAPIIFKRVAKYYIKKAGYRTR